jgi:hypothetical protein
MTSRSQVPAELGQQPPRSGAPIRSASGLSRVVAGSRVAFPISFMALVLIACGGSSRGDSNQVSPEDLPKTCGAYLARYESCLSSLAPGRADIAKARTAQARDGLVAALAHGSSADLSQSCIANLSRLASCGH